MSRGAAKTKSTGPSIHLLNPSPTRPPADFLFLGFYFIVRFWAFLGKGSSKTPYKYFCKKSMSKTFSKKVDEHFDGSFSSTFFVISRFLGDRSSKTLQKSFCQNSRVEKFLQRNRQKIQNRVFLGFLLSHFLGVSW
jgi:hypothetical protein